MAVLAILQGNITGALTMTDKNKDESLAEDNTEYEATTERMGSALSRMTDEDMQNLFDRAFADFQASMLDPNRKKDDQGLDLKIKQINA